MLALQERGPRRPVEGWRASVVYMNHPGLVGDLGEHTRCRRRLDHQHPLLRSCFHKDVRLLMNRRSDHTRAYVVSTCHCDKGSALSEPHAQDRLR